MGDIIKTAQCRFCGQMVQIETDKELTQPQAEEQAIYSREFLKTTVNLCISHRWTNTTTDTLRKTG